MNSGPTQFPPKSPEGPQLPGSRPQGTDAPNARLIGVPNDLQNVRNPVFLKGQVVQINADGSVKVDTPRGTVDIVTPRPPEKGDHVEIVVLPGRPPKQAVVKTAPEPSPDQTNTPPASDTAVRTERPAPAPAKPETQNAPETRPAQTPVDVVVRPPAPPAPAEAPPPPARPEDVVKLLPLAPSVAAEIIVPEPEVIIAALVARVENAVQIIAAQAQNSVTVQTAVVTQPPVPVAPPVLEQLVLIPGQPQPVLQPVTQNPAQTPAAAPSPLLPQAQTLIQSFPALTVASAPRPITAQSFIQQARLPLEAFQLPLLPQPELLSGPLPAPILETLHTAQTKLQNFITAPAAIVPPPLAPSISTPQVLQATPVPALPDPFTARIVSITPPDIILSAPGTEFKNIVQQIISTKAESGITIQNSAPSHPVLQNIAISQTAIVSGFVKELPVLTFFSAEGLPSQNFAMQSAAPNLVPGVNVEIAPLPGQILPAVHSILPLPASPLAFLTPEPWPLLDQIYQILAQASPQAAQMLSNVTPNPGNPAQIGPAILFFLAAVRGGDLTNWLNEKASDVLRNTGRGGLITRLGQEGNALSRLSSEPMSQDWRGLSLPLYWQGEIHKMALYYKHDKDSSDADDKKSGKTRFIFDLSLSNMGPVQLDGLFRAKRLDLVVRTEKSFSEPMQMEMRRAYASAIGQSEMTGELSFQNKPEQWVSITPLKEGSWSADI